MCIVNRFTIAALQASTAILWKVGTRSLGVARTTELRFIEVIRKVCKDKSFMYSLLPFKYLEC